MLGVLENWPCRKWLIVRRIRVNYKHLRYVIVSSVCCHISCRVHVKGLDHAFLNFILLILPVTIHHALWNLTKTELLSVNDKITASCPTDILRSQALNQSVTNNKNKLWKTVRLKRFQNPTISIRRNLFQISPSVLTFIFAVLLIPSFNVLSGYFYVLLNLMAVLC